MKRLFLSRVQGICLAGAAALVMAAAADAHTMRLNNSMVTTYGWGAAATYAKQQSTAPDARAENDLVSQYGWGAAAAYAKLHS